MRHGRTRRAGFTMIELIVTCVVLSILATIAIATYNRVTNSVSTQSDSLYLSRAEVAANNVAADNGYQFPATLATQLSASGLTFVAGVSTGPQDVSVDRVSGTEAIFADSASGQSECLVLVDNLAGTTTWGSDPTAGATKCTASSAASITGSITSTKGTTPSRVSW